MDMRQVLRYVMSAVLGILMAGIVLPKFNME